MKKIYYCFMALSAAALVSCSDDAPSTGNNSFTSGDNAVAFTTYVDRAATSRGAVTDYGTLQGLPSGIGVFASYTQGQAWATGDQSANFMFNQQVGWNGSSW